jgi:hypothetical protein
MNQDEQQRITDREQKLELSKSQSNVFKGWVQVVLLVLVCVALGMMIWGMNSWRKSSNVVGATNANVNAFIDEGRGLIADVRTKLNEVDTAKLNSIADKVGARVDDLGKTQVQLTGLISDVRYESRTVVNGMAARLDTLDTVLVSARNAVDEVHTQIRQNGDASTKALNGLTDIEFKASAGVDLLGTTIGLVNERIRDKRIDAFIDSLGSTGGNVDKVTANLALISGNFEKASREAPEIAALWRKMMQTSSKYQKYLIVARIIGLVGPVFGPLVP